MDTVEPTYSFRPRVLRRWAEQHLQITATADGGHEAVFRLAGSTCGNIEFDLLYYVTLGPAATGHQITALRCRPAPMGEGHTRQCCWRENAGLVTEWMRNETPLLHQPLDAVLTWNPAPSPSGCLCHANGRTHKWNAVLQTLHYALNQSTPHV